jgi:myo-inositol-1(or 4)-monophosphatase
MIDVAIQAAKSAGDSIRTNFSASTLPTVTYKDPNNVVTQTDIAAENAIFSVLKKEFPDHAFFSEEAGLTQTQSEYLWVIDPLDGTSNFAHHLPFFCVSIALFKQKQPVLGVIYDPIHDELFSAETNQGAHLNSKPITSNTANNLQTSVFLMARSGSAEAKQNHTKTYNLITANVRTARVLGSGALSIAYVACGRFDGVIINDCNFYDCAAANIIAREAGATVSDFQGNALIHETEGTNNILVTNKQLHPQITKLLIKL